MASVGGLIGENENGIIRNSYATGNVTGADYGTGGLVGFNYDGSSINNSYATGNVTGTTSAGGLVGENENSSISNSYATGAVSGDEDVGGLVGFNSGGTVTASFWDADTTGQLTSAGSDDSHGKTTTELLTQSTYTAAGWDFGASPNSGTWFMIDGETRPFLQSEYSTSITNSHQLQLMAMDLSANYTLANNINMSAEFNNVSGMWATNRVAQSPVDKGFMPVGGENNEFTGSFDGQNFTITGLTISRSNFDNVGLFGVTGADASISNVGLINVDISNANYNRSTGGLVGLNYGSISNSHVTGSVSGDSKVGGLVGVNVGLISNSHATASVLGFDDVGGLVGENAGNIIISYASGIVSGEYDIGGLVGTSYGGSITNSYATGDVTGDDSVGGLVGSNYGGNINHSYATGSVEGADKVGGLVGSNYGGNINHSYATGSVEGTGKVGGLVGYNEGTLNNSFYNAATVQINGATFVDEDGMPNDDGILTVGGLYGEQYRTWIRGDKTLNPAAANSDGFIEINTLQNFKDMLGFSQNAGLSFIQTADIDLNNDVGLFVPYFAGQFNGDGYSISNATINVAINSNIGLFGDLRGSLQGVTALNVEVSGNRNVGGLVGRVASDASIVDGVVSGAVEGINANAGGLAGSNHGDISYSDANVTVDGSQAYNVGGFVGFNNGLINDVEAAGAVNATANVGGLVGTNYGSILMAEANGDVTGSADYIGGLVGMNNGMIANGVATGNVNGDDYVGGLVGLNSANRYDNPNASITNSRAGGSVSGQDYVGGLVGSNSVEINLSNANYADVLLTASIENSYASGNVTGSNYVGGLVGQSASIIQLQGSATLSDSVLIASIVDSHATGDVLGDDFIGGLVGASVVDVVIADSSNASNLTARAIVSGTFAVGSVGGLDRVGGLVGVNKSNLNGSAAPSIQISALINDGYATGNVNGDNHVGGLVGSNYGYVERSYAYGTATGNRFVGGLVGYAYDGAIENSYATGLVLASSDYAGGLVGKNAAEISQSYATGRVIESSNAGGLVGDNTGIVSNSFWNKDSSGTTLSAGGNGLTSEQMMQLSSFSDWSIDSDGRTNSVWRIYEGHSAPLLRGFMEDISLLDTTVSYNGAIQSGDRVPNGRSGTTAEGLNVGTYSSFSDQQGYNIVGGLLTIEALPVSVTGTREYDGSIDLDVSIFDISGLLDGESLTLNGIGLMNDKHVGFDKTVIADRLVLSDCIDTGCVGLASNYTFSGGTQTVTITQKSLMQSGLSVASSKVYDGTRNAVVLGSASFGSQDVGSGDANDGMAYNGDAVSITGAIIGTYNDKDVADATTVSFSGMSLTGADANNYSLLAHADAAATITQANALITANSGTRYYNGLLRSISGFAASGLQNGETLSVLSGVSAYGSGVEIGTYPVVASGTDGNYHLTFIDGLLTIEKGTPAAFLSVIGAALNSLAKSKDGQAGLQKDNADENNAEASEDKVNMPKDRLTSLKVSTRN